MAEHVRCSTALSSPTAGGHLTQIVYRGGELHSPSPAGCTLKLKLWAKYQSRLDTFRLSNPNIGTEFGRSINNCLGAVAVDELTDWEIFKKSIIQSAWDALGSSLPSTKQPWISQRTLDIIECCHKARLRGALIKDRQLNHNVAIAEDKERYGLEVAERLDSAAKDSNLRGVCMMFR